MIKFINSLRGRHTALIMIGSEGIGFGAENSLSDHPVNPGRLIVNADCSCRLCWRVRLFGDSSSRYFLDSLGGAEKKRPSVIEVGN